MSEGDQATSSIPQGPGLRRGPKRPPPLDGEFMPSPKKSILKMQDGPDSPSKQLRFRDEVPEPEKDGRESEAEDAMPSPTGPVADWHAVESYKEYNQSANEASTGCCAIL